MKNNKTFKLLPLAIAAAMSAETMAAITLYDEADTSFSVDGLFNTYYVNSDTETDGAEDSSQARVKMGFLPNYIGFNFSKKVDDLTVGGRSSFWVSTSDSDLNRNNETTDAGTDTLIDVRQFYATVDGSFGQVLLGKDFALFNRSNILGDEILLGYGQTITTGDDGGNVSFGNIGTGYLYPFPNSQITYRSPDMNGFKVAVGLMDPTKSSANSEESSPRIEGEATYNFSNDNFSAKGWVGFMTQKSEDKVADTEVKSSGTSYGLNVKFSGLSVTASGFKGEGVGAAGLGHILTADDAEVDGMLLQASYSIGSERFVISRGENEGGTTDGGNQLDMENQTLAWFHSVNSNLTLVVEHNKAETDTTETKTLALGAVVTF